MDEKMMLAIPNNYVEDLDNAMDKKMRLDNQNNYVQHRQCDGQEN